MQRARRSCRHPLSRIYQKQVDGVELQATMAEPEDVCAAYVQIQAGEGGTDSADWAQMLMRMYIALGRASRIQGGGN